MSALSDNRNTPAQAGDGFADDFTVIASDILYAGGMGAIDSTQEIQPASDTLGLRVVGRIPVKVDNTADGLTSEVELGVFRYANSSTAPLTRAMIGDACYVEDDQTVAATSTNLVAAGLVVDVDSKGVWVDQRLAALTTARRIARPKVVAVTGTTSTLTAAQAFQGNVVVTASNSGATTLTMPAAATGLRIGVQRLTAGAGYDVVLQAGSGDTVRGSTVAGTATNDTDAVSQILWLEAENVTNWADASPLAADRAEWAPST
jgi:hypothetical protein